MLADRRQYCEDCSHRKGIVLLLVLSMLALFSMLAVSYYVFANRARGSSESISRRERHAVDATPLLEAVEKQLLRDASGPESSLYGHSLLGDYYGTRDGLAGRIRNAMSLLPLPSTGPDAVTLTIHERQYPQQIGQMFSYLDGQFLRLPTNLADTGVAAQPDLLNGRICTFTEGPLEGVSFEIVRSFGDFRDPNGQNAVTSGLTGGIILDLTPQLMRVITHTVATGVTRTQTLLEWVKSQELGTLFYSQGGDGAWGIVAQDDNNNSANDDPGEAGTPATDDVGYGFVVSPQPLNGFGVGVVTAPLGMDLSTSLPRASGTHSFPVALQPHYALYRDPTQGLPNGDTDEPWDAIDTQNFHLAYFPADAELGAPSPSFVRPALVNFILNELGGDLTNFHTSDLRAIIRLLQRCTLRPLPIQGDPSSGRDVGQGVRRFRYDQFSGSSPNSRLATEIEYNLPDSPENRVRLGTQILEFARGLALGPWDVDTDGDGMADSVWIDAGLPLMTMSDGTVVKPMAAVRIEDLGGRIDLNSAGSWSYFGSYTVQDGSDQVQFPNSSTYLAIRGALARRSQVPATGPQIPIPPNNFEAAIHAQFGYRGFGFGPADMSLQTMFWANGGFFGNELLKERFGRSARDFAVGRTRDPYVSQLFPGSSNDIAGFLRDPHRPAAHYPTPHSLNAMWRHQGMPQDTWGRGAIALDPYGQPLVSHLSGSVLDYDHGNNRIFTSISDEANNDPGEMLVRSSRLPDAAFSVDELESILRRHDWGAAGLPDRLHKLISSEVARERSTYGAGSPSYFDLYSQVTTISNSTVTPSAALSFDMRSNAPNGWNWTQEVNAPHRFVPVRIFQRVFRPPGGSTKAQEYLRYLSVIPSDIRLGRKFNLNRPLGNDADDNGNGVIDDSGEPNTSNQFAIFQNPSAPVQNPNMSVRLHPGDYTPETGSMLRAGPPPAFSLEGNDARQLYARHLYCMMMFLLKDQRSGGAQTPTFAMPQLDQANNSDPQLTARRIAQWAVNAVDFRDPDSIMTGFKYDPNPYDGWDVDGDLRFDDTQIVWGMEAPALLLTEGLAFHNRNVKDTDRDSTGKKRLPPGSNWSDMDGDDDVDQVRIPQGSLYLELFCPRTPSLHQPVSSSVGSVNQDDARGNPLGASADLYTYRQPDGDAVPSGTLSPGYVALDLGKLAPDGNPVWRIGVSRAHFKPNTKDSSPQYLIEQSSNTPNGWTKRDYLTFQPERMDSRSPRDPGFQFDRVIWFANKDPQTVGQLPSDTPPNGIFYNRLANNSYFGNAGPLLSGGQYAVVGPRASTVVGSKQDVAVTLPYNSAGGSPKSQHASEQRIELTASQIRVFDLAGQLKTPLYDGLPGNPIANAQIRPIVGIIAAAKPPTMASWPTFGRGSSQEAHIGINISEPIPGNNYYQEPTLRLNSNFMGAEQYPIDAYCDFNPNASTPGQAFDTPFDSQPTAPLTQDFDGDGQQTGTREDYKTAYLQRLADPTRPYDVNLNPYITVDWMPLDLTVFNGEEQNKQETDSEGAMQWLDRFDEDPFANGVPEMFATRYKSGRLFEKGDASRATQPQGNLFSVFTSKPVNTPQVNAGTPATVFNVNLRHANDMNALSGNTAIGVATEHSTTLGYLNHSFGQRWTQSNPPTEEVQRFVGAPDTTRFPWIVWLDRPYSSPLEILLVPFTSPGTLGFECATPNGVKQLYQSQGNFPELGRPYEGTNPRNFRSDYQHLPNFFSHSDDFASSPNFYRILDWLETPDPFDDTGRLLLTERFPLINSGSESVPPTYMFGMNFPPSNGTEVNVLMPLEIFRTPFNHLPSPTRRGLVNLNTINGKRVYRELMQAVSEQNEVNNMPTAINQGTGAYYDDFVISRRGYDLPNFVPSFNFPYRLDGRFDPDFPTEFAGAFVPGAVADMAPRVRASRSPGYSSNWPSYGVDALRRNPVEAGILRQTPPVRGPFATSTGNKDSTDLPPLFSREGDGPPHQDRNLSAFHRYQGIMRLANLTTNQSNVYAVWTTVGLFTVDVDTLTVGEEYGFDQGNHRRYRSFMIIDRSIPVRFEPGVDHNSSDVVVLRRTLN